MTSAVRHGTATSTDKKPPSGISPGQASACKEARQRQTAFTKEEARQRQTAFTKEEARQRQTAWHRMKHGSGRQPSEISPAIDHGCMRECKRIRNVRG